MSDSGTARQAHGTHAAGRGRALTIALWVLQVILALQFVMAGLAKLFGDPAMVEMFATIGIGQWFRYVVGRWRSPVPSVSWSHASPGWPPSGFSA